MQLADHASPTPKAGGSAFAPGTTGSSTQALPSWVIPAGSASAASGGQGISASAAIAQAESARTGAIRTDVIRALGAITGTPNERLENIARAAREALGVKWSLINMLDATTMHTLAPAEFVGFQNPLREVMCAVTIQHDEPFVVPDATLDDRFSDKPVVTQWGARFYAGVPITTPGGTRIGTLCVLDPEPRTLHRREVQLLSELGQWAERTLTEGRREDDQLAVVRASRPERIDVDGYEIDGMTSGCAVVGDFVDWQVGLDGITLAIGDVLGAGHGAGLLATSLRSALRARSDDAPGHLVATVEQQVEREFRGAGSHAAVLSGRLDPVTGRFDYVDAGLGLGIVVRADGSHEFLRSDALPIGLHAGGERPVRSVTIGHGDALLIATPGFLRLHDGSEEALVLAGRRLRTSYGLPAFLEAVETQARGKGIVDQVTMLVVARA